MDPDSYEKQKKILSFIENKLKEYVWFCFIKYGFCEKLDRFGIFFNNH